MTSLQLSMLRVLLSGYTIRHPLMISLEKVEDGTFLMEEVAGETNLGKFPEQAIELFFEKIEETEKLLTEGLKRHQN